MEFASVLKGGTTLLESLLDVKILQSVENDPEFDLIRFAPPCSVIGQENLHHLLYQSDAKVKPIMAWTLSFPFFYLEFSV